MICPNCHIEMEYIDTNRGLLATSEANYKCPECGSLHVAFVTVGEGPTEQVRITDRLEWWENGKWTSATLDKG